MSWVRDSGGLQCARTLLLALLFTFNAVVNCQPEIPGPHFPFASGGHGDTIINSGTLPRFLSYSATDMDGKERVYVPVFVAVKTDAGETAFKDVRQNTDKSITIHGEGTFFCAFGHPYRQFAFLDKYKWEIAASGIKNHDNRIPLQPLIRCFLADPEVVKDIMLKATTEPFNRIAGGGDFNVDQGATNQFGLSDKSKVMLEAAALPGSLITYAEDLENLRGYTEIKRSWGEVADVAVLKRQFSVPDDIFPTAESSMFLTKESRPNSLRQDKIKIANYDEVIANVKSPEWKQFATFLREMENVRVPADPQTFDMHKLSAIPINEYKVSDFATTNTVKNYINIQHIFQQRHKTVGRLLDSFEMVREATNNRFLSWNSILSQSNSEITHNNNLRMLKDAFIKQCANFIADQQDTKGIKNLQNEMKRNGIKEWKFVQTFDDMNENLRMVLYFLKSENQLANFPDGKEFTKSGLIEYFKKSLTAYIQSDSCKLSNNRKNFIVQTMNSGMVTQRNIAYTTDHKGSKIFIGDDGPERQLVFPGDTLSVDFDGQNIDISKMKSDLSKVFTSIWTISPPKKVTLEFPDTYLNTESELLWKKRVVEIGDYLRGSMKVQSIDLIFKQSQVLKYDMISHTLDNGIVKEMPFRFENGHLVIDNRIAPFDIGIEMEKTYNRIKGSDTFKNLLLPDRSDIEFIPNPEGFFLSNSNQKDIEDSVELDNYRNKQFNEQIKTEIIVTLTEEGKSQGFKNTAVDEASNMLVDGYRQKNKNNVILVSATKNGKQWTVERKWTKSESGTLDNVRISIVGIGDSSSQKGVLRIGGQRSEGLNDLIKDVKTTFSIKDTDLQKVSIVACNPDTLSKGKADLSAQLAQSISKTNKVTVSTRLGYVKIDQNGHKWYSDTDDGEYHRRQYGDVFVAVWDPKGRRTVISKTSVENFMQDIDIKKSDHLGFSKTVNSEHMSEIFKDGLFLKKELLKTVESLDLNREINPSQYPESQKRLQKLGNYMSAYGMLQTATFLLNAEKCEKTNYSSAEVCEARKKIAIISLTQEVTEIVHDAFQGIDSGMKTKPKFTKPKVTSVTASSLKSFGKTVLRNPLKGLPVLGLGLDTVSLGLDIYDLTKAKTPTEKGIAGTSVALSSLSLIASATALTAGILGATAVAAVAGPAAIVVGVVALLFNIGVTIWQTIEYEKKQIPLVNQAAGYFETMHTLYGQPWYNCSESTLIFTPGISVKTVDLTSDSMHVYSEYMCETARRNWKTHVRIYPLLLGSTVCKDYDRLESNCYCNTLDCAGLINVRSGMNIAGSRHFECNDLTTIILNTAPIVLRGYTYARFDHYDSVIGLIGRNPESKFQDTGHDFGIMIDHNNPNFDYYYHFCFDKYAIINSIGFNKYIHSVTEIYLGNYPVNIVIPNFQDPFYVTLSLIGFHGTAYNVFIIQNSTVHLKSKPDIHSSYKTNMAIWKVNIAVELVSVTCYFYGNLMMKCEYEFTNIEIISTENNQVIFIDKHNIRSVPLFHDNKIIFYIAEVEASNFFSDEDFIQVMNRYLVHDFIALSMTYTPVYNLSIMSCGDEIATIAHVGSVDGIETKLYFTSEFPGRCSGMFNTDAKIQLVKNGSVHFSSSLYSLSWQTHFQNNSLKSFATLPCHSELRSEMQYSVIEDQHIYISQRLNLTKSVEIEAIYRLTRTRLYLLSIASEFNVHWRDVYQMCFHNRSQIFSDQEKLMIKTMELNAGENDITFVNTSNTLYWVRKKDGYVVERIFPNLNTSCSSLEISFDNITEEFYQKRECADDTGNNTDSSSSEIYYFLCMNGKSSQLFVQFGNNQAKSIESLRDQQIYFDGKDILVRNKTEIFSFDNSLPSKLCLYEYEIHLPFDHEQSLETFMVGVSQDYGCVESKVKLKFKQLVGWFDFEESIAVLVHESISSNKLRPVGATSNFNRYWMWDTMNNLLYLQDAAEPSLLSSLVIGNITEQQYQSMILVPDKVITNVQDVSYQDGRTYVSTSDGATYHVDENGKRELLAITDFWLAQHPNAESKIQKETDKEVVMYRPDVLSEPSYTRCKRSSATEETLLNNFFLYHITFKIVFYIDSSDSVFIGSNPINMSIYTYTYQNETLLETDRYGFVNEDRYELVHRLDERTLIVESNEMTENTVPPVIDGIKTMILSTSSPGFIFDITELLWSKLDEILLSEDSSTLAIYLELVPCDYTIEQFEKRTLLIDYAHSKKIIIPNAEERSENGLIELYVCGERVYLHSAKYNFLFVNVSIASILVLMTAGAIILSRRKRRSLEIKNEHKEGISPHTAERTEEFKEVISPHTAERTEVFERGISLHTAEGTDVWIPNEQEEMQCMLQTPVHEEHMEVARQKATALNELRKTLIYNVKEMQVFTEHRILTRLQAESCV